MKLKHIKFLVYTLLAACILLNILTTEVTGRLPHILSGLCVVLLTGLHIWLSRQFFLYSAKHFFTSKLPLKGKVNFVIDVLLIGLLAAIAATGGGLMENGEWRMENLPAALGGGGGALVESGEWRVENLPAALGAAGGPAPDPHDAEVVHGVLAAFWVILLFFHAGLHKHTKNPGLHKRTKTPTNKPPTNKETTSIS